MASLYPLELLERWTLADGFEWPLPPDQHAGEQKVAADEACLVELRLSLKGNVLCGMFRPEDFMQQRESEVLALAQDVDKVNRLPEPEKACKTRKQTCRQGSLLHRK